MDTRHRSAAKPPVLTAVDEDRAAAATLHRDPDLVLLAFYEVEPDGSALIGEIRIRPHDKEFSEDDLKTLLEQWPGNAAAEGMSLSFVRQLALGSLDSAVWRRLESERQGPELVAPNQAQIERLVKAGHRFGLRNTRDAQSHLRQLLVAEKYVQAVLDGQENPTDAAALASGLKPQQVARLLILARKHGYLTSPQSPGKPGGYLTHKAADFINEANSKLKEDK